MIPKKIQQKWGSLLQFLFLDLENSNDGTSNFRTSSSIMIKNVPSMINVLGLKRQISVFGKISKASKRSFSNGLIVMTLNLRAWSHQKNKIIILYLNIVKLVHYFYKYF